MEQPTWEADSSSASYKISHILRNPKVHCCFYNSQPFVPVLSHIHPIPTNPYDFLKSHFNIILQSTPSSAKWSPSLRLPHPIPVCTSPFLHPCYMPSTSHSSWVDHLKNIWYGAEIIKDLVIFVVNIYHNSVIPLYQMLWTINKMT